MCTRPGQIVPDREQYTILSPQFVTTIGWNPSGFHVVKALPKWSKFNPDYSINNILVAISDWRRLTEGTRQNKFWIHADNARPHTTKVPSDYIARNEMKMTLIHLTHQI
jgi:hypothetical protein